MADLANLGVVLVTSGFTLGGVSMDKTLERSSGHDAWHRSERRNVYAQHLTNSPEAWRVMDGHYVDTYLRQFGGGRDS